MGTDCHVLVAAPDDLAATLAELARERVELLEQCWSRFRPTSELNRLNASAGAGPMVVSADLLLLVMRMQQAWELSEGRFDPTVLTAIRALGYDADFAEVAARPAASIVDITATATPGMSGIAIDPDSSAVALPAGVGIDPGAIGKGLAADVIAEELAGAGATAVLVNLGGDISVAGTDEAPWSIGIEDERRPADHPDRILQVLQFEAGTDRLGVATSTTVKRRWAQGRRHHVIDPRTGTMSASDLVQVTVVASTAWEAEVLATTALLKPSREARTWLREQGVTGVLLTDNDEQYTDEERRDG
jgi:thiamine biosynthesis lipoprotein